MSYICQFCQKQFSNDKFYKKHIDDAICTKKHICKKCNAEFATAYSMRRHAKIKTPCAPNTIPVINMNTSNNRCMYCGKSYASVYSLRRHKETCSTKNNPSILLQLLAEKDKVLAEKDKVLAEKDKVISLQQQLMNNGINPMVTNHPTVINNNVTVNQVNQNLYVNVTICSFGQEDLSRLDTSKVMKLLKGQIKDFMPKMIEHVHANPEHPEYHNVYYDPQREKAIVFAPISATEMSWQSRNFSEISADITKKIKEYIRPGSGPYVDMAMQDKDTETSNKIILLANEVDHSSEAAIEKHKGSLSKVTKNQGFLEQVSVVN